MAKIHLRLDALRVESFDTQDLSAAQGTVLGFSYPNQCDPPSDSADPGLATCDYATCAGGSCWQSCNGTCVGCGGGSNPWQCQQSQAHTYCWGGASCLEQCDTAVC